MLACPFQVPVYEWSKALPKVRKCDMCYSRLASGGITTCSEVCPAGATITGDRDAMIKEANRRLAERPRDYTGALGITEAGGTSVLMLSAVSLEQFGFPARLPKEPLPPLTGKVLSFVPDVVGVGGVLLGGIYWITHRRDEVAAEEGSTKHGKGGRHE
jgi:formate dehydrogenase iron-sulfur subunit